MGSEEGNPTPGGRMKKLPSAAEVRGMAGAVAYATRTSTIRKGTAIKLPDEIRDALLQFAELLERERWIPVAERLPEFQNYYLAVIANDGAPPRVKHVYFREEDRQWIDYQSVTHWRPLPQPPEGE